MSEKRTKQSEIKRILDTLNKSEDHQQLFNTLKEESKAMLPDTTYLDKVTENDPYLEAMKHISDFYKYDSKLKKYVKKLNTFGRIGKKPKMNKGGAVHIDYRKKGLFK